MVKSKPENIVSPQAADLLISLRDGDAALLYLFFCRHGFYEPERARTELVMPEERFRYACERLEMKGLLSPAEHSGSSSVSAEGNTKAGKSLPPDTHVSPAEDPPAYSTRDVSNRADADEEFAAILNEAKLLLGRPLSSPDLVKMLGIYDHFSLPAEVMMELMHFVADDYRRRYQERRRPTVGAFEREARKWAEQEIRDFDAAERYIQKVRDRQSLDGALKEAMQIQDRDFTETEQALISQWLDWGFPAESIALAYDITVTRNRKFKPGYMNGILQNWHQHGLHTLQEIREKDRPPRSTGQGKAVSGSGGINTGLLEAIQQTMNLGRKE